jgi:hypothetical protein
MLKIDTSCKGSPQVSGPVDDPFYPKKGPIKHGYSRTERFLGIKHPLFYVKISYVPGRVKTSFLDPSGFLGFFVPNIIPFKTLLTS